MTSPVTASERDPRTLLGIVSDTAPTARRRGCRPPTGLPPADRAAARRSGIKACSWGDIKSRR